MMIIKALGFPVSIRSTAVSVYWRLFVAGALARWRKIAGSDALNKAPLPRRAAVEGNGADNAFSPFRLFAGREAQASRRRVAIELAALGVQQLLFVAN